LINSQNLSSLETNDVFRRKLATTRASKYANLVTTFSKNQILHECKVFEEELFASHEDQEIFYWYVHFELYEFELLGFNIFYVIVYMYIYYLILF
jgi:hypothetical protein